MNNYLRLKERLKEIPTDQYSLPMILGMDSEGKLEIRDLSEVGSLLIGGATGSGKSVFLGSLLYTLLQYKTPRELGLIFVDPKYSSELLQYVEIPHLLHPLLFNASESYEVLVRFLEEKSKGPIDSPPTLIIIDEMSDLMCAHEEKSSEILCRLAIEGKKLGIYLVLASSRASPRVFTEKLREAIPNRIAFSLATDHDSMVVLGAEGARDLRGRGDMLYRNDETGELLRLQAPIVECLEAEELAQRLKGKAG